MFRNFAFILFVCMIGACMSDDGADSVTVCPASPQIGNIQDFWKHTCRESRVDFLIENLPLTSEIGGVDHWFTVFSQRFIPCDPSRPIHLVELTYHVEVEQMHVYMPDNLPPGGLPEAEKVMYLRGFSLNLQRRTSDRLPYLTKVVMDGDSSGATITMSSGSQPEFGQMTGITLTEDTIINLDVIHLAPPLTVVGTYHTHFLDDNLVAVNPADGSLLKYRIIDGRDTRVNLSPRQCRE